MSREPFIERSYESGADIITVRFLQPALAPGGEYQCKWAVQWPGRVQQSYSCGVDGVQSLMLAMKFVHSELMESDLYKAGNLTYFDEYDLDLPLGYGNGQLYDPPESSGT
ncbi:hypothetical protein U1839_22915 [Sphingomonas sp. RT2P30]|uniref:DUF6968 family protein n=1 Tax=Parasphingomonas halimpatiens TaxID=3096162 RepID=UPI002FC5CC3D